jgi:hypothetical protein
MWMLLFAFVVSTLLIMLVGFNEWLDRFFGNETLEDKYTFGCGCSFVGAMLFYGLIELLYWLRVWH